MRSLVLTFGLTLAAAQAPLAAGIDSKTAPTVAPSFDIVSTRVTTDGNDVVFRMSVTGEAGADKPVAIGRFASSNVHAYVWPTSLDSEAVGFDPGQGIVALAVTFHPDFDDAAKGARNRDVWHTHLVVLVKDASCGAGGLKVRDIPPGAKPRLPETWPGVPLLIDSPDYKPTLSNHQVEVRVPRAKLGAAKGVSYDGVTAALHVNANLHSPLLCVPSVFKVASGDLSLPGKLE